MMCEFEPKHEGRLPEPVRVECKWCGQVVTTRTFPVRAECELGEVQEFIKATPEYQQYKTQGGPSRGLGDFIADVISVATFGLITSGKSCGCERRRDKLNRAWKRWFGG